MTLLPELLLLLLQKLLLLLLLELLLLLLRPLLLPLLLELPLDRQLSARYCCCAVWPKRSQHSGR